MNVEPFTVPANVTFNSLNFVQLLNISKTVSEVGERVGRGALGGCNITRGIVAGKSRQRLYQAVTNLNILRIVSSTAKAHPNIRDWVKFRVRRVGWNCARNVCNKISKCGLTDKKRSADSEWSEYRCRGYRKGCPVNGHVQVGITRLPIRSYFDSVC